jgi:hypothetical protein
MMEKGAVIAVLKCPVKQGRSKEVKVDEVRWLSLKEAGLFPGAGEN